MRIEVPNSDLEEHVRRFGTRLEDYIWLPQSAENTRATYHPKLQQHGLLVAQERSRFKMSYNQRETDLHKQGALIIILPEFTQLGKLLELDEVYDGNGNLINKERVTEIKNEIFELRDPWRAEYIGNRFNTKPKVTTTSTTYFTINQDGKLIKVTESLSQDTLLNGDQLIDLSSWFKNITVQGLPNNQTQKGSLNYCSPRNYAVAMFYAHTLDAGLLCSKSDNVISPNGVREVRGRIFTI